MRIIDRYVIRQVLLPFAMGLMVFTFLLIIPNILKYGEEFVARGVSIPIILRLMATLIPQAIALAIPMSLLLGLLVGFGRLSADREFVAMQACGVSLLRLLRPVTLLASLSCAATAYVMIVSLPDANQTFRDITFGILTQAAESEVKPRVFFDGFPNLQLYVRDVATDGSGWTGVFMADARTQQGSTIYTARRGRALIDREKQTVQLVLDDVTSHSIDSEGKYRVLRSARQVLSIDPSTVFQRGGPIKGDNEMTIAELRARAAELVKAGSSPHNQLIAIHQKFSIPAACLVFALIGLALGATNRRDGALGSFVLGVAVVVVHYILLYLGQSVAKGGLIPPWLAAWLPDIILGSVGIAMFAWRDRVADRPIRIGFPAFVQRRMEALRIARIDRTRGLRVPGLSLLDRYVAAAHIRIFVLSAVSLLVLFEISAFIDRSSAVFKGVVGWGTLAEYLLYVMPQYVYYVLPLAVLLATLVTVSLLTKNSELIVMKACGISLYRVALPMLIGASVVSGILFSLDQTILGEANHRSEFRKHLMRGGAAESFEIVNRHWAIGTNQTIYHYNGFNPRTRQLTGLDVIEFGKDITDITQRTSAERADFTGATADARAWALHNGWTRKFSVNGEPLPFTNFVSETRQFEPPSYFGTEQPDPDFMTYSQLRRHTEQLRSAGFNVLREEVTLDRKVAFPFVTLIMTLIAVPFAVTMGRSGAMGGIAIGIALAITYWTTTSLFGALGAGGMLTPILAAWAPNMLFGAGAIYLLLTVRT